jgi:hypothetical protein
MIPLLNELVGLPPATSPAELACASEKHFQTVFDRATAGDVNAQRELVTLRLAYLNWAYASPDARQAIARRDPRRN